MLVLDRSPEPAFAATCRLSRILWWVTGANVVAVTAGFSVLHLRVDFASNPLLLAVAAAFAALIVFYSVVRNDPRMVAMLSTTAQYLIILLCGLLLSYAASAVAFPYKDAELYAIDRWLGADRGRVLAWLAMIPESVLDMAYLSISLQTALVPAVLMCCGRLPRFQVFVLAFAIALAATVVVAAFVPAMAAYLYVDLAHDPAKALPAGAYSHVTTLEKLRSGTLTTIRLDDLEGLLTFPSFHTANAVLFAWALWDVRWARILGVVVNALMIISTPYDGQHYVIDVIVGGLVACLAIGIARVVAHRAGDEAMPRLGFATDANSDANVAHRSLGLSRE